MTTNSASYLTQLHQLLNEHFNLAEIEDLCFRLHIDYESVPGDEKPSRIRALLLGLGRNGRLPDLIAETQKLRPRVAWPSPPDGFELPEALETAVSPNQYHVYGDVIQGDKFTGDKIGRDKNVVGDVSGQSAVAVGERAQAIINRYGHIIIRADTFEDLPPVPGDPPYKGLAYFTEADKDRFFGRENLSDNLANELQTTRFLTLIGASGSGKSSLLRAGIIPRLRARNWLIHVIKPGVHPLATLAATLTQDELHADVTDLIGNALATNADTLTQMAEKLVARAHAERLLLAVDQFEELFTQCQDDQEGQAFVDNLVSAAQAHGATTILLSMRADFYDRISQYKTLTILISQQQVYIKPMTEEDLVRAIAEPAKRGGWQFVEGLVEQFVADVGNEPGRLPLLSHALLATWERRRGVVMTLGGYRKVGGVEGAIAKTAEETMARLGEMEMAVAKSIFLSLTELGEGSEDTRRIATLTELTEKNVNKPLEAVLQTLTNTRLITTSDGQVEVAHEALIRRWPRLRDWLADNRERLRFERRLEQDASAWEELNRDKGVLYRGARLQQAIELVKKGEIRAGRRSYHFLAASHKEAERETQEKKAQQQRELEQAKALAAEQKRALIGGGVLVLFLLAAVIYALIQTNNAQKQASVAQSRSLATSSLAVENGMRALLLAIEAGNQAKTIQAFTALDSQLLFMLPQRYALPHENNVRGAALNDDKSLILTWSSGEAVVWDVASGERQHTLPHEDIVTGAAWNVDESLILTWSSGSFNGTVIVWDAANGERQHTLPHENRIGGAAWNGDESLILTWSSNPAGSNGEVVVWDVVSGERRHTLPHEDVVNGATWNGDESLILTWSSDPFGLNGKVVIWDAVSSEWLHTLSHEGGVNGAVWNGDESLILTWSSAGLSGEVVVWDAASGERRHTLSHENRVGGATWNDDESLILTWSDDGTAVVWDAASGERQHTLFHEDVVNGTTWNGDESLILTWSGEPYGSNGEVVVWDAASGERQQTLPHEDVVNGATWNGDENLILTWSGEPYGSNGKVVVWDAISGERRYVLSHEGGVHGAEWNDDESLILTYGYGEVVAWDVLRSERRHTLSHEGRVNGAVWNGDESLILTWSGEETVVWDVANGERRHALPHEDIVNGAMWNSDESLILTWSSGLFNGTVVIWDATSGERQRTLSYESGIHGATWNGDESLVLTWSGELGVSNGTAVVWDVASGERRYILSHESVVNGATWNGDESLVLTWSGEPFGMNGEVVVWDAASGERQRTLSHEDMVRGATWNGDESLILTWSNNIIGSHGEVVVWDAASGERRHTLPYENGVNGAMWNSDESLILTWSSDPFESHGEGEIVIWDAASGERLDPLSHEDSVRGATWNNDENQILSWGDDGTVKIWDVRTGVPLRVITPDGSPITDAQWNQNEDRLLVATEAGIVRIYYTNMDELLDVACQSATRNFRWNEWHIYFPGEPYRQTCPNLPPHPSVP